MQISLFISTRVHQWSGGTNGRTDTVLIGRSLSTGSNVLKFNSSKKSMRCRKRQKGGKIESKHLFQYPAQL